MKDPATNDTTLGEMLQDSTQPLFERLALARYWFLRGETPYVRARAGCWLTYRSIESPPAIRTLGELRVSLAGVWASLKQAPDCFLRSRWLASLLIALAYANLYTGSEETSAMEALDDPELIGPNPSAAVNVCRGMVLLAARRRASPDLAAPALTACLAAFRQAVAIWPLANVHACAGAELVSAAKAVDIAITLAPHCGQPYRGVITPLTQILTIETALPFRGALALALGCQL